MLLMDVELITGFAADTDSLQIQSDIEHHKEDGSSVFLYFDGVSCKYVHVMFCCNL